ncbi:MAG: histidinol-phosphate transaminase [Beduini sp.]|uniref:histidinol-phosphate transaminase n=1 Tax=Beduini sp. TaxID=1922300 RepID=UPI0039904DD5
MSWKDYLRDVEPYVAGEQPKMANLIKLNTNENPYGPSPKVEAALKMLGSEKLRLYPDADASGLKKALADLHHLKPEQIFIGNGSDEVLALSFLTFFNSEKPLLFPDITYSFYPVYTRLFDIPYKSIPLNDRFEIVLEDYKQENGGIIFPNPNAPTGILVGVDFIEELLQANPNSMVIIDEAYIDFGGESCIPLLEHYDNLLIIQTFSKSRSLAGLRIGVAYGNRDAIKALQNVKNSFNSYPVDYIAQHLATASVLDHEDMLFKAKKVIAAREYTIKELRQLGFEVLESKTNFVFARHPQLDAEKLLADLRAAGIIVRHFNQPRIDQFLRISIGTITQMEELIKFLKEY